MNNSELNSREKDFSFNVFWDNYLQIKNKLKIDNLVNISKLSEHINNHPDSFKNGIPFFKDLEININNNILYNFAQSLESLLLERVCENYHNLIAILDTPKAPKNPISFLADRIISGKGRYLIEISEAYKLNLDELAFFGVYLIRPIREIVRQIFEKEFKLEDWRMGYCPVCGLWPRMARLEPEYGQRILWCVGCNCQWRFPRMVCPFCYETNQGKLGYLTVEKWKEFRIYTCESCHHYLKTRDERIETLPKESSLDLDYFKTSPLDTAAMTEKFISDFVGFTAFDMIESESAKFYHERVIRANT